MSKLMRDPVFAGAALLLLLHVVLATF